MLKNLLCHTCHCVRNVLRMVLTAKGASCNALVFNNGIRFNTNIQINFGGNYANRYLEKP